MASQQFEPASHAGATEFHAEQCRITVLVIDIGGFTTLSREIGEARISALMTAVFRRAGTMLDESNAWSQKFIGDAVMAVWRHPDNVVMSDVGCRTSSRARHASSGSALCWWDGNRW